LAIPAETFVEEEEDENQVILNFYFLGQQQVEQEERKQYQMHPDKDFTILHGPHSFFERA